MDLICIELKGAVYQLENIFQLDNFWIIPATKNTGALGLNECKVILASEKGINDALTEAKFFVFCYQFLFPISEVYHFLSLPHNPFTFTESGKDINDIAEKIYKKYETGGACKINFNEIDTFSSKLPYIINFEEFYNLFIENYNKDDDFKNIIDLFLFTIGSRHKFYDNVFQKMAQLQTIFETIMGTPEQEKLACGKYHYKEEWRPFLERKLAEKEIRGKNEIDLIIQIKNSLNREARVKYAHNSKQMNVWEKTLEDCKTGNHTTGEFVVANIIKKRNKTGQDWENLYYTYLTIIKLLIYLEYFKSKPNNIP